MTGQHLNQNSNHARTNHTHRFIFANSQKPRTDNNVGTSIYRLLNKSSQILRTMLSVGIKLDHIVISMVDSISSCSLKTNRKATVDRHCNDTTAQQITYFSRSVMRTVIDDNEVKLWGNRAEFSYCVFNAFLFVICWDCNKHIRFRRQSKTILSTNNVSI